MGTILLRWTHERVSPGAPRDPAQSARLTRAACVLMALLAALVLAGPTLAEGAACPSRAGPVPTTGGARPGPFGLATEDLIGGRPGSVGLSSGDPVGGGPVAPVSLSIPALGVDAGIEILGVVDRTMQDPTGPWVVGWYPDYGSPGASGNTVMAGHVNYVEVGPAVFAGVGGLAPGAEIDVVGADGRIFRYAVDWVTTYEVASLTDEDLAAILGQTGEPVLTLITCGGVWDEAASDYLSRIIVRATLIGAAATEAATAVDRGSWMFRPGATAEVAEVGVSFRAGPSTQAEVIAELAEGTRLRIAGRRVEADGYAWWPVRDGSGRAGFVAGPYLSCVDEYVPTEPSNRRDVPADDGTAGPPGESPHQDGTGGPGPSDDGTAGPAGMAPVAAGRRGPPNRRA